MDRRVQLQELLQAFFDAESKRIDEVMRTSEARYRIVMEAATEAIITIDEESRIVFINQAAEKLFGYSVAEMIGQPLMMLMPEALQSAHLSGLQRYLETGAREMSWEGVEFPGRHQSGRTLRLELSLGEFLHHDKRLFTAIARDITARQQAMETLRQSEERYRLLFERTLAGIFRAHRDGQLVECNASFARILGYASQDDVLTHNLREFYADPQDREHLLARLQPGQSRTNQEVRFRRRDGQFIWVLLHLLEVDDAGQMYVEGHLLDITEQKLVQEALEQHTREITQLNELGDLLQSCSTHEEAYAVIAHAARQLFPACSGAVGEISPSRNLIEVVTTWGESPPAEVVFAPDACWALRRGQMHMVEDPRVGVPCRHVTPPLPTGYLCIPMMAQGEVLGLLHLRCSLSSTSEPEAHPWCLTEVQQRLAATVAKYLALTLSNLKLQEALRTRALRDPLTGLFNRRYLDEWLERELRRAARKDTPLGVIMVDLDHFKRFNEEYGDEAGDILLREVGALLQRRIRGEDIACRYGGEEFALFLPEAALAVTRRRAEDVRAEVKQLQIQHQEQSLGPITVSLGVVSFPEHGTTAADLLRAAEAALARAKAEGRDRVVVG